MKFGRVNSKIMPNVIIVPKAFRKLIPGFWGFVLLGIRGVAWGGGRRLCEVSVSCLDGVGSPAVPSRVLLLWVSWPGGVFFIECWVEGRGTGAFPQFTFSEGPGISTPLVQGGLAVFLRAMIFPGGIGGDLTSRSSKQKGFPALVWAGGSNGLGGFGPRRGLAFALRNISYREESVRGSMKWGVWSVLGLTPRTTSSSIATSGGVVSRRGRLPWWGRSEV